MGSTIYNREQMWQRAVDASKDEDNHFITDLIAALGIDSATFYRWWPSGTTQHEQLQENLNTNRVNVKKAMRKNWRKSDNPALQIGLYKLLGDVEERRRLSSTVEVSGEIVHKPKLDLTKLSTATLLELKRNLTLQQGENE